MDIMIFPVTERSAVYPRTATAKTRWSWRACWASGRAWARRRWASASCCTCARTPRTCTPRCTWCRPPRRACCMRSVPRPPHTHTILLACTSIRRIQSYSWWRLQVHVYPCCGTRITLVMSANHRTRASEMVSVAFSVSRRSSMKIYTCMWNKRKKSRRFVGARAPVRLPAGPPPAAVTDWTLYNPV